MTNREISNLYFLSRYPQHSIGVLTFLIYLPLGVILLLLRVILGLHAFVIGLLLPDVPVVQKFISKLLCLTLGITINVENPERKEDVPVYISNCVTPFDHLVVHSCTGSVMPGKTMVNSLLSTAFGIRCFGSSRTNFNEFKKNVEAAIMCNTDSIIFQPEYKRTNGKAVLKFKTWPFALCTRIQPVCIEVSRPLVDIKVSTFDSSYWIDMLVYMFSLCTSYKLRFLPAISKMNLSEAEFAEKVRQDIAMGLKVELSEYSAADLLEWEKQVIEDMRRREWEEMQQRPSTSRIAASNPEIHRMAHQVKEVLPTVPFTVICSDLVKTWSVDQTISNILEGHVTYIPEPLPSTSIPSLHLSPVANIKSTKQEPLCMAAPTFGKSAHERMLSFQERKQQLIESARQRYIEKHGLNIVGSS